MSCADTEIGRSGRSQSEPRNKRLINADTTYALLHRANDLMRERFTSKGHTLDDNLWRTCQVLDLQSGFWQAVRDRDFGSVLTYAVMLAGRDVNVADLIHDSLESYNEQMVKLRESIAEQAKKIEEKDKTIDDAVRSMETMQDTIRLMGITEGQHKQIISDLRAKLGEHGTPEPYRYELMSGVALESERIPELCYSVETVCGELVETLVIQGDPAAVKDLVQTVRAEQTTRTGPGGDVNTVFDVRDASGKSVLPEAGTVAAAVAKMYGDKHLDPKVEMAKAWHGGEYDAVVSAMAALHDAGKDPVAFIKRMKNVAVPPDNDEAVRQA
ncbi:hypothetical protein S6a_00024 [Klebsiella phage VLCpiS6a]|nr:hypothetical protein S6a_00024 [Klebsiella phage VLCpiS6a]